MVTEVRTLRVDAQLNDQYSTTAKKIEEANRGIGASGKTAADGLAGVGTAANDTVTKISRANDGIERMKRQLIAGYASSVDFERGLRTIAAGLDKGKLSAEQASAAVEGLTRKFGLNANAAQFAERGQLEFARAIDQANAKIAANATASEKAIDAQRRLAQASNQNAYAANQNRPGAGSANTGNIVAQFQDIGITAAMGMSPMTIALQQGSQLSSVLAQSERPLQALMAGFAGLLSPISLATVATVGLGAAAIQYFSTSSEGAAKTNGLLREQADIIKQAAQNWGDALPSVKAYAESLDRAQKLSQGQDATNMIAGKALDGLGEKLEGINQQFAEARRSMQGVGADPAFIRDFGVAFGDLREKLDEGTASFGDVNRAQMVLAEAMASYGTKQVLSFGAAFDTVTSSIRRGVEEARKAREEFFRSVSGGTNVQDIVAGSTFTDENGNVRQTSTFTPKFGPTPQRRPLIELEGINAPKTSKNIFGEISKTLDRDIERQQLELSLIGKTTIDAEGLRKQFELIANLKAEAAKTGTAVDEKEIDLIKKKTAEYSRLAEEIGKSKLQLDLSRQLSDRGLSSLDLRTVQTLRQYGLSEDLGSQEAGNIRNVLQQTDARDAIKGFLSSFQAELVASGGDVGDAFAKAFKNALNNVLTKILDDSFTRLTNAIMGALFKGSGGAASGSSASVVGAIGGAAVGAAPVTAVTRSALAPVGSGSALSFVGNYKTGVDPRLTDILGTAAQQFPGFKVDAISGFRPGDPRFHGKGMATDVRLTDLASGKMLGNYQDASSFGTYERFAQTARSVQMEKYPELADKFRWGGYFGGGKGKYGALDTMHFDLAGKGMAGGTWQNGLTSAQSALWPGIQSQGMEAAKALDKLAGASSTATTGLGSLGDGLGKLGSSLGSAASGAASGGGGGGGIFSFLGSLFGGGGKSSGSLFGSDRLLRAADGTPSSPGGLTMVGERGRELINMPRGAQVFPSHQTESLLARRHGGSASNQNRPTMLQVVIQGASGDDHVRSLVNEGVQTALASHNENQRRTGFGSTQNRYVSQRG